MPHGTESMSSDEEKTRKWQQPAAEEAADDPTKIISFYCPNGHRIKVEARLAGKSGQCSKCGVVVKIPAAGSPPKRPPGGVKVGETATTDMTPATGAAADFDFLGAAGRPDESAEPAAAEPATAAEAKPPIVVPPAEPAEEPQSVVGFAADPTAHYELPPADIPGHPTADLVARLWAEREHGGKIEVHHAGGVFLPEWFEAAWSRGTHGLFASQAADGTIILTAVAWDSVQKIIVRNVEGLPDGMFE
jgi:hypothetical protein